jgi:hypothetical protein
MKQVATALIAMTCFALLALQQCQAQQPKMVQVSIMNHSDVPINVQGYTTFAAGVKRNGNIFQMKKKGGGAIEPVHAGTTRYYTIYDANQPARVLLRDFPINVPNRNIVLKVLPSPTNPKELVIVIDQ